MNRELYDHHADPGEWTNLASDPEREETKKKLAGKIPSDQHSGLKVRDWFDRYRK